VSGLVLTTIEVRNKRALKKQAKKGSK
jgi:hypothetical protein